MKIRWDTVKFSNPMWRDVKCRVNRNCSNVWINTHPRDRGIWTAHFVWTTKRRNFAYLNSCCISTWYAQKRQDIQLYLIFAYNYMDKGMSGRNLQRLTSRGMADQLYIQTRSLYCPKRATCFGCFLHLLSDTGLTIEQKINKWYTKH